MHGSSLGDWRRDAMCVLAREAPAVERAMGAVQLPGRCALCDSSSGFDVDGDRGLREGLRCRGCGCNARQRAAGQLLLEGLASPRDALVRATEQASHLHLALRRRVRLVGSEYLPSRHLRRLRLSLWLWRHRAFEWIRHGDATAMRDADGSVDAVISLDVLEHIPEPSRALREFARVIRPGGCLVLTVPFYENQEETRRIADVDARGRLVHFGEPEFHGDPVSGGVPCFHHFGWQLLRDLREAGFADAEAHRVQDPERGLPEGQWVIRAWR